MACSFKIAAMTPPAAGQQGSITLARELTTDPADPGFGIAQGTSTVHLTGPGIDQDLAVAAWAKDQIIATLPASAGDGAYTCSVFVRPVTCQASATFTIGEVVDPLLFTDVNPKRAGLGSELTITCSVQGFAFVEAEHGPLRLLNRSGFEIPGLSNISGWGTSTLKVTLPTTYPNFPSDPSQWLHSIRFGSNPNSVVFTIEQSYSCDDYAAALAQLFEIASPLDLAPGTGLTAQIVRSATPPAGAAQLIVQLLQNGTSQLSFAYQLVPGAGAPPNPFAGAQPQGSINATLSQLPATIVSGLYGRPIFGADGSAAPWPFEIVVDATVTNLPGCTTATASGLIRRLVQQLPVGVPTLVAGFDPRWWEGSEVIVFLQPGTTLVSGRVDRNTGGQASARGAVVGALRAVSTAVQVLAQFFPNPLGLTGLAELADLARRLDEKAAADIVFTAEASNGDIGTYNPSWYDRLSSLIMVGVPGSGTFSLFEQKNQTGPHVLEAAIPDGFIAASYWTLHQSAFHPDHRGSFTSPPTVPDPGNDQEGRADNYPFGAFGNMAKSFSWS